MRVLESRTFGPNISGSWTGKPETEELIMNYYSPQYVRGNGLARLNYAYSRQR
jgi:hypothetical protein